MSDALQPDLERQEAARLDAADVARTLAGDLGAYDALIERYQRRAVSVSYRLLGNMQDAMDVAQDAFLKGFKSLATLEQTERFGSWLLRIVSNLSLNYRRARRPTLSLTTGDDDREDRELKGRKGTHDSPDEIMQTGEAESAITKAIEALPEKQRLALILFAIEQVPQKEVAEILECSIEMVKWNVFQARKTLKKTLAEFIEE
ncbi:MAG TPA: sigma-70 family RNA polymerase sigma factor [Phycisphaerae bacterium]|nr:sigma-70 family RNA polymerase sigma factor [Phycisphaerae bacterium]